MKSSHRRTFSIFSLISVLAGISGINISNAAIVKYTLAAAPTNVTAVGGLNSATLTWKAPYSNGGKAIISYKVTYYPGAKVHVCNSSSLRCVVDIRNPNKPSSNPASVWFYFTVAAVNSVGTGPVSIVGQARVLVRFRATIYIAPKYGTPTPSPTPTPMLTPTAVPTPSPSSKQTGVNKFDGNYQGQAVVTITPSAAMASGMTLTIPISFTVVNGMGTANANGWVFQGQLIDSSGTTTVTASSPVYGSITFTVNFTTDPNTKIMSGTGSGTRTFTLAGIGSGTMSFVFSVITP